MIKGGGDIGSGVAWRLHRCGFPIVVLETSQPTVIRRAVAFAAAVYEGAVTVEGVVARRLDRVPERGQVGRGDIPVLVDPCGEVVAALRPAVVVDAILAKRNTGTRMADAPLVVALGPGFRAGHDCHAVVETARGHTLGRVYWRGAALAHTGVPGEIQGISEERVLRAPAAGVWEPRAQIGDLVQAGQPVAWVAGQAVPARIAGVVRGLLYPGLAVTPGMKVGDVDPRGERANCFTISDKALAVAGGVLEAVVSWLQRTAGMAGEGP